ncbi:hypothetical protein ES703_53126 [subsurface metagenome]
MFGNKKCYFIDIALYSILESGFDVYLFETWGAAGKTPYGIDEAGIVGVFSVVNGVGVGAGVVCAVYQANLCDRIGIRVCNI